MTRARSCSTSRLRSLSAVTASPMSRHCGPSQSCSARSPLTRRRRGSSQHSPRTIDAAVAAIRAVRVDARAVSWARRRPLAGAPGKRTGGQVIIDIDATLVSAHSDKEGAEPTFKRGFGFAPMCTFVDHGEHGTSEALARSTCGRGRPRRGTAPITSRHCKARSPSSPNTNAPRCWCVPTPAPARRCFCTTSLTSGWSTRSGSRPKTPSNQRSRPSPSRRGGPLSMVTASLVTAPGLPSSPPGCRPRLDRVAQARSTGQPGCGSSPAVNGLTPAPSCG